jgi:hypothetical protein
MMDMVLAAGIAVGLIMGSFGYVLVRFVLRPVMAYRRLKRRLAVIVKDAARNKTLTDDNRDTLRHTAAELQELLDEVLPVWYALSLQKRGEQPKEAAPHLQALANCREPSAVSQRAAAVIQSLRL